MIRGDLGNCYAELGRTVHAIQQYSEALEIASGMSDESARATCLQWLGNRYSDIGDLGTADRHYAMALDIYESLLSNANGGGSSDQSRLVELKEERALLLINVAFLRIDQKRFREAIKPATTARVTGEELGHPHSMRRSMRVGDHLLVCWKP